MEKATWSPVLNYSPSNSALNVSSHGISQKEIWDHWSSVRPSAYLLMCARDAFRCIANAASSSGLLFALTSHLSVYARSTKRLFALRAAGKQVWGSKHTLWEIHSSLQRLSYYDISWFRCTLANVLLQNGIRNIERHWWYQIKISVIISNQYQIKLFWRPMDQINFSSDLMEICCILAQIRINTVKCITFLKEFKLFFPGDARSDGEFL